jgi:hypothetical protein
LCRPPHSGKPTRDQNSAPRPWNNSRVGQGQRVTSAAHHTQGSQLGTVEQLSRGTGRQGGAKSTKCLARGFIFNPTGRGQSFDRCVGQAQAWPRILFIRGEVKLKPNYNRKPVKGRHHWGMCIDPPVSALQFELYFTS